MAKVIMHEAKDGSLHKTAKECEAQNLKLRLAPAIEAYVSNLGATTTTGLQADANHGYVIAIDDLPKFLVDQADALRKVLNEALVIRRPRKAAKKQATAVANLAVAA